MFYLLKLTGFLLSMAPDGILVKLADALVFLCFDLLRIRRSTVLRNLETAFGDSLSRADKTALARTSYKNFVLTVLEFWRGLYHPYADKVYIEGVEKLRQAASSGEGFFLLCMHMGNWEALGGAVSQQVVPAHVVVKKVGSDGVDRFVEAVRQANFFYSIKRKSAGDGYRKIRKALRKGDAVGFVMDQRRPGEPHIAFLGKPAQTNTSFASIWFKCQRPIFLTYITRNSIGNHTARVVGPLQVDIGAADDGAVMKATEIFNRQLSEVILKHPEHYFWLHERWR